MFHVYNLVLAVQCGAVGECLELRGRMSGKCPDIINRCYEKTTNGHYSSLPDTIIHRIRELIRRVTRGKAYTLLYKDIGKNS